jgi:uncharacterized membrane protein HdeD (DUF308 family)
MFDAAHARGHPAEGLLAHRGWFVALGVLLLVLGVVASLNLILATVASIYVLGVLMILGGVAQLAHAARVRTWGQAALGFASGVLYAVAGALAFLNPLLASGVLTLMIAAALLVSGRPADRRRNPRAAAPGLGLGAGRGHPERAGRASSSCSAGRSTACGSWA